MDYHKEGPELLGLFTHNGPHSPTHRLLKFTLTQQATAAHQEHRNQLILNLNLSTSPSSFLLIYRSPRHRRWRTRTPWKLPLLLFPYKISSNACVSPPLPSSSKPSKGLATPPPLLSLISLIFFNQFLNSIQNLKPLIGYT